MSGTTLDAVVADMIKTKHSLGFRFKKEARVLHQFTAWCQQAGCPTGPVTQDVVAGFLYEQSLRASTIRRNEIVVAGLASHAATMGVTIWAPTPSSPVRVYRQSPYVFTDDEICRFFHAVDTQPISCFSIKHLVDPVLFRVLYATGLRISEALKLTIRDVDLDRQTFDIKDSKNGKDRIVPFTRRLAETVAGYIQAAHPAPEPGDYLFYTRHPSRLVDQSLIYLRFRDYLLQADIPHFAPGGPTVHSFRHGLAVRRLKLWAEAGADMTAMLPYLSAYLGHVDLRGTQYYLRLTTDLYPHIAAQAQLRFGYVIPVATQEQP